MSFIGNIVGGILGAKAAGQAANAGVQGAQAAQALEKTNQTAALGAQQTALTNVTGAEQPYQSLGSTSANALQNYISQGFTAPTLAQAEATPGYQFNLQQGTQAIDENAAATGTLMSGNTGVALQKFGQGLAQNTYQQAYQNALNQYTTNVGAAQGGVNSGLSSTGQLANANLGVAGNIANVDLTSGQEQAQQLNNAAAARASGYLGEAKGYGQMAAGIGQAGGMFASGGLSGLISGGGGNMGGWSLMSGYN